MKQSKKGHQDEMNGTHHHLNQKEQKNAWYENEAWYME